MVMAAALAIASASMEAEAAQIWQPFMVVPVLVLMLV